MDRLILASTSPRRRELLASLGWAFRVVAPQVDERPKENESPEELVLRLSREKAQSVARQFPRDLVLGSDTVVALDGCVLGKPADEGESFAMLQSLSGRTHRVWSGCALVRGGQWVAAAERADVTFRNLDDQALRAYVATGEGRDKAGSYALQGRGALLVQSVSGHPSTVIGLPLVLVSRLLGQFDVPLAKQWEGSE